MYSTRQHNYPPLMCYIRTRGLSLCRYTRSHRARTRRKERTETSSPRDGDGLQIAPRIGIRTRPQTASSPIRLRADVESDVLHLHELSDTRSS